MKKTFRFLALSFALICGTLSSFAAAPAGGPTVGTLVGNNEDLGVVVYEVLGWNDTWGAYEVQINELNWTGIQTKPSEMTIKLAFEQMYGTTKCKYVVTKIKSTTTTEKKAFYAQTNLKKVEFVNDENVIKAKDFEVGAYSFYGCSNLAELIFPDNVWKIDQYAFQNTGIKNFDIPANCQTIDPFAFNNCQSLNTVTVREGEDGGKLKVLGENVFANSTLTTLDLSKAYDLTTIGSGDERSPFIYKAHSTINNQLTTVFLPEARKDVAASNLTEIYNSFKNCTKLKEIKNLEKSAITKFSADAFNNDKALLELNFPQGKYGVIMLTASPFKGCESLATLTFAADFWGTIGSGVNLFGALPADAASLAALKTITFNGSLNGKIESNAFGSSSETGAICTSLATLTITNGIKAGNYNNGTTDVVFGAEIGQWAFAYCGALETVTLNGISISGDKVAAATTVLLKNAAFANTGIKTLKLGGISITNNKAICTFGIGGVTFSSKALESVEIGDITISSTATGSLNHEVNLGGAFSGGDNFSEFTVGNISNNGGTINIGTGSPLANNALGTKNALATVTIGNIATSNAVNIGATAFQNSALTTVTLGNFTKFKASDNTAEAISIGANAFDGSAKDKEMAITIGNIAATTSINANSFWSGNTSKSFTATLGDIKKAKDSDKDFTLTIAADAFGGPAKGDVTYTLGEVSHGVSAVAAGAFVGTNDETGTKKNAIVKIGAYKQDFPNSKTFTLVKELEVASWETSSSVYRFDAPYSVTVTGDMTNAMYGDNGSAEVKELNFLGNITKANAIAQFGNAVRKIAFGKDKNVATGAVATSAFTAASNKAKNDETINVVYACSEGNESLYNAIFAEDAFGGDNTYKNVVLFTTVWAQNNIFENTTVYANGIYRMEMSASSVAPGDPIKAKLIAGKNGKNMYGKLYIPKGIGMIYKIDAKVSGSKNGINVFSGHLDNDNIYMKQLDTYKGAYWIDATEENQVFIVRTSDMTATEVEAVVPEDAEINDAKNVYWFGKTDAKKNCLQFTPAKVVNQELQNNAEFMHKSIYVMANPAKFNLAFAKLNQYTSANDLPANSLYVLSDTDPEASGARLNVVFEDEIDNVENATGIQAIEAKQAANDGIYNLQGVRVKNAQKGIYIINGKKVIK